MELDFDTTMRIEQSKESLAQLRGQRRIPLELKPLYQRKQGGFEEKRCTECGGPLGFNNKSGHCCHCNFNKNHFSKHYTLEPCTWCGKNHIKNSGLQKHHKHLIKKWNGRDTCPYSAAQRKSNGEKVTT